MPMTTYDTRISYWSSDVCSSALSIQTALFGAVIIGDTISVQAIAAILISLAGVIALSVARTELTARRLLTSWLDRPALIGLASAAFFRVSAVSYRASSLSLDSGGFASRSAFTLSLFLLSPFFTPFP